MSRVAAWGAALAAAGCAAAPARPVEPVGGRGGVEGAALALYRDGAVVRTQVAATLAPGRTEVALALPQDVEPGAVDLRVLPGGAEAALVALVRRPSALRSGDEVEVGDGERAVRGALRCCPARDLVVEADDGLHVVSDPALVRVRAAAGHVHAVVLESARGGEVTVELVYVTRTLGWSASYALALAPGGREVELRGALGIVNHGGTTLEDARITLVDGPRPQQPGGGPATSSGSRTLPPVVDPTRPRAEQPPSPAVDAPRAPEVTLPYTVDVAPGEQAVSLLPGPVRLPARQTLVFDAVGDGYDLAGRVPTLAPRYGLDAGRAATVAHSVDVDVAGARLPAGLPAGAARLAERTAGGALTPLGEARIFERAGSGDARVAPTISVAIGTSAHVSGRRSRREFTIDEPAKRLVEEFAIELTSTADEPREVIVREHLYRGLNWTLAYHNAERGVTKEGPQKIALRAVVPARGTARVVYRIVYHWAP